MDSDDKLTKALAAMDCMEKLMEALNNDLETLKEENRYLKAVVETNNDLTNPDHPLYKLPTNDPILPVIFPHLPSTFPRHHQKDQRSNIVNLR